VRKFGVCIKYKNADAKLSHPIPASRDVDPLGHWHHSAAPQGVASAHECTREDSPHR
jgi:hypothetical protein